MGSCAASNKRKVSHTPKVIYHMIQMSKYQSRSDYINHIKLKNVPKLCLDKNLTYLAKIRRSALRDTQSSIN